MGDKSKIEWTRGPKGEPGATWNPIIAINRETGKRGWFCVHVDDSCRNCYAERQNVAAHYFGNSIEYTVANLDKVRIELEPNVLEQPLHWTRPRNIFVCSMTDLFGAWVTDAMLAQVWAVCELSDRHVKQILTKRVDRMVGWLKLPIFRPSRDFWLGFSAGEQKTFDERWAQIKTLAEAGWMVWCSLEPLLGPIDLKAAVGRKDDPAYHDKYGPCTCDRDVRLCWVVSGSESGPHARPSHPDWFLSVMSQCKAAGVPFFMKQITVRGKKLPISEWPEDLRVREFPEVKR